MRVLTLASIFLLYICPLGFCGSEDFFYPQRIISLGPALTEQLYLLGAEERLVGVTTYCKRPPQAQEKEKIGTVVEVDLEKIVLLQPDLILTTSLTNPKTKEKLKNLGIKTADFPQAKNFSQICEQFLQLGRTVGREKEAEEIIRQAKMKVDAIKERAEGLAKKRVFFQLGAKPLVAATTDSFLNDLIKFSGGINIVCACESKSGLYSREKVVKANPDIIIITAMGITGKEEKKVWKAFAALNAVKFDRIYIVDDYTFCSPTPVNFVEALEEMVKILHPENE